MKYSSRFVCLGLIATGLLICCGCSRSKVEVIDLNKVLDIYDQIVKSKEDPGKAESDNLAAAQNEDQKKTQEFLQLFADALNKAKLIRSHIGVDMQPSGMIRGFIDQNKNRSKGSNEAELFTLEFDTQGNRIIATQKVAGQQYRRDHRYGPGYHRFYYYHYMHGSMWYRQNRYYSPSRPRPNYSGFTMSSPNYHSAAVSKAQSVARSSRSSRSSSRSSARGYSRSGGFSGGK